jgi:hypothetical protein
MTVAQLRTNPATIIMRFISGAFTLFDQTQPPRRIYQAVSIPRC